MHVEQGSFKETFGLSFSSHYDRTEEARRSSSNPTSKVSADQLPETEDQEDLFLEIQKQLTSQSTVSCELRSYIN